MDIPFTERRSQIGALFTISDWEGLQKLGIAMVEGAGPFDCASYVVGKLGYVSTSETLSVVHNAVRVPNPPSRQNIIIYSFKYGKSAQHYGLYERGKVISKWCQGPVFMHSIEDVPDGYGNWAEFIEVTTDLRHRLQQAQVGRILGPDYY